MWMLTITNLHGLPEHEFFADEQPDQELHGAVLVVEGKNEDGLKVVQVNMSGVQRVSLEYIPDDEDEE